MWMASVVVTETMKFERAVGFSMDGPILTLTIDEKKCGKYDPLDVLEQVGEIVYKARKNNVVEQEQNKL